MDAYKAFIFSGFLTSPPPAGNTTFSFLLLSFPSPTVSSVLLSSEVFDGDLPAPQCWPGIWCWWITVFFSFPLLFLLTLSFMLSFFTWIKTGNETGSPYDAMFDSLDLCVTIIYSLNCSPRSPLTKVLFSVMIEALIFCSNGQQNMVLHATPYPRERETVTGFPFIKKGVLWVITVVTYTPTFNWSLYFPPSTPLILNGSTSSISFRYTNSNTKVGWSSATD